MTTGHAVSAGHAMVDRCVCHSVSLAQLKELSREVGADFDSLSRRTGCGTGCGLCVPYVHAMLRTGATVIPWGAPAQPGRTQGWAGPNP